MPYGAQVNKLEYVTVGGDLKIAVHPKVMEMFHLSPNQDIDMETARKVLSETERLSGIKQADR